ncbi:MAG: DUF5320 domain-containing protein [Nitrososphaerota archaeon]|nr:DUF5320 domain-containing protein [Nitrososphaerota archaeon]
MSDNSRVVTAKISEEVYKEFTLRISEGERGNFIREAISEKLQKTPRPDKILALEERMDILENELEQVRKYLSELELLTFAHCKIDLHSFCIDETDRKIIDYLMHYKGATTPELAEYLKSNRWIVLNRLQKIQKASKKKLGKSVIDYYGGERAGKKKAWWINQEVINEDE